MTNGAGLRELDGVIAQAGTDPATLEAACDAVAALCEPIWADADGRPE